VPYSQLPQWYGRVDVFVHPAPNEPWGVSVTEALACGIPVLAAAGVGAATELATQDGCVKIFANADASALADELTHLARQPEELQRRSKQCQHIADQWHYKQTIHHFQQALLDADHHSKAKRSFLRPC
jgi:glycosyltransferase involved in cell wall biosynthesis